MTEGRQKAHETTRIRVDPLIGNVLIPFFLSRLLIGIVGSLAIHWGTMQSGVWRISNRPWLDIWARWDSGFYLDIAANGYSYSADRLSSVAFFPLYPLFMKLITLGSTDKLTLTVGGWIISNCATLIAFYLLYRLVMLDWDRLLAGRVIWLLAFFPTSFFLSVVYSEGIFLVFTVAAFFTARRGNWLAAGILGAFSAATRPVGAFLIIPLAYEWYRQREGRGWRAWSWQAWPLLLIPTGLILYMVFLGLRFDDPLLFSTAQAAWGRTTSFTAVLDRLQDLMADSEIVARAGRVGVEIVAAIIGVLALVFIFSKQRISYGLYTAYVIGIPLMTIQVMSVPRFLIVAFPVFIVMAQLLHRRWIYLAVLVMSTILLAAFVARWSLWHWIA